MQPKRFFISCLLASVLFPGVASALVVEIQGKRLEPSMPGASCVEIEGEYPGLRIEPSEAGAVPRICYTSAKINSISIVKATLVALPPIKQDVTIRFEHDFPAGINGKIMARAKLAGFFSTATGLGVPVGDKLSLKAHFSQAGKDDEIGEPFHLTVGDQLDSALFDYAAKEQYLIAGPRVLKGELKISFRETGHKLTLPEKSAISIDTGSTFEDKLDTLALPEDEENPTPAQEGPPGSTGTPSQSNPGEATEPTPGTDVTTPSGNSSGTSTPLPVQDLPQSFPVPSP